MPHRPGFALLIWAIDIVGALLVLRLIYVTYMASGLQGRKARERAGISFRWASYSELRRLWARDLIITVAILYALKFLFGAPRWLP